MISDKLNRAICDYGSACIQYANPMQRYRELVVCIEAEIEERVIRVAIAKDEFIDQLREELASAKRLEAALREDLHEAVNAADKAIARAVIPAPEHRPFDEAAARAGEAIEWRDGNGVWNFVEFIGMFRDRVVFTHGGCSPEDWPSDRIRMAPRPMRTVWLNVYNDGSCAGSPTKSEADISATKNHVLVAYPVQVPTK